MNRIGKTISLVVALCLIVSIASVGAFAAGSFTDVPTKQWYYKYVTGIVEKNIMSGTSATTFTPNGRVTRAQVVQTEYAMAEKPKEASVAPFTDVPKNAYYVDAVNWAYAKGIAAGYGKTFDPSQSVTREQFATFLYAYASKIETADKGLKKSADIKAYTDSAKVANYALNAVKWAVGIKIIDSTSSDAKVLDPKGTLTRAQLATMLLAYVNYSAEDKSGLIESIRVQDTMDTDSGKEAVYSIHLNGNASWGSDSEADKQTALKVIKEVMDKSRADGYAACDLYVYQANNCMAFLWMEFNPQYISLFDAQGGAGDTVVLTEEQVTALGATIPDFYNN